MVNCVLKLLSELYFNDSVKLPDLENPVCVCLFCKPSYRYFCRKIRCHGNKGRSEVNFNTTIRFSDHDFLRRVGYFGNQKYVRMHGHKWFYSLSNTMYMDWTDNQSKQLAHKTVLCNITQNPMIQCLTGFHAHLEWKLHAVQTAIILADQQMMNVILIDSF